MSQPVQQGKQIDTSEFTDEKKFSAKYLNSNFWSCFFAWIFLILGLFMFFWTSGILSTGSNPSGCAGSSAQSSNQDDSDGPNYQAIAFFEFLGVVLIILGVGMLTSYMTRKHDCDQLFKSTNLYGMAVINGKKDAKSNPDLLAYQTTSFEAACNKAGLDYTMFINPPPQNTQFGKVLADAAADNSS